MARSSTLVLGVALPTMLVGVVALPGLNRTAETVGAAFAPTGVAHAESAKAAQKGDRLQPVRRAPRVAAPATVEVVGLGPVAVILRDRGGNVLYRTDLPANTTTVARDADLPVITVKERVESPVSQQPAPGLGSGNEGRGLKVGCEGYVSSLVAHEVRRIPGRCTATNQQESTPVRLAMN